MTATMSSGSDYEKEGQPLSPEFEAAFEPARNRVNCGRRGVANMAGALERIVPGLHKDPEIQALLYELRHPQPEAEAPTAPAAEAPSDDMLAKTKADELAAQQAAYERAVIAREAADAEAQPSDNVILLSDWQGQQPTPPPAESALPDHLVGTAAEERFGRWAA